VSKGVAGWVGLMNQVKFLELIPKSGEIARLVIIM